MDKRSASNETSFTAYDQMFYDLQGAINATWLFALAPIATILLFFVTFGRLEEWSIWLHIPSLILTAISCIFCDGCVNGIMISETTRECDDVYVPADSQEIARQTMLRYINDYVKTAGLLTAIEFGLFLTWFVSFVLGVLHGSLFGIVTLIIPLANILIAALTFKTTLGGLYKLILTRKKLSRG